MNNEHEKLHVITLQQTSGSCWRFVLQEEMASVNRNTLDSQRMLRMFAESLSTWTISARSTISRYLFYMTSAVDRFICSLSRLKVEVVQIKTTCREEEVFGGKGLRRSTTPFRLDSDVSGLF